MGAPYHINWNITYQCNFNCTHCYSRAKADTEELTFSDKVKVAENISLSKVFSVNLGGGEPLLCEDTLEIAAYLSQRNVNVAISTNGWKATPELAQRVKDSGTSSIRLSLDNADPEMHDCFRGRAGSHSSALNALHLYSDLGIPVFISTTLTSLNFDNLEALVSIAEHGNASGIDFKRLRLFGNACDSPHLALSKTQESQLYEKISALNSRYLIPISLVYGHEPARGIDGGCPCGKTVLCLASNGDICPCVYSTKVIGNALNERIDQVWQNSDVLVRMREHSICLGMGESDESL
jgi:MoaA/NifB/PqqE/SkfB family radical SAM enzyme